MFVRALVLLPLAGVLSVAGCSNNPNPGTFEVKDQAGNIVATAKSVPSGTSIEECVDPLGAYRGEAYCPDPDGDNAYAVNSADPFNGSAPTCLCLSAGDPGEGWNSVTTTAEISTYDCAATDPLVGAAETEAYVDADGDGLGTGAASMQCGVGEGTGFASVDGDCDDTDPLVGGPSELVFSDFDGDGFGIGESFFTCTVEAGQSTVGGDCDDLHGDIKPGAIEVCDDLDNNCDEAVDNDPMDGIWYYADADGDGEGGPEYLGSFCEAPLDSATTDTDCDDGDVNTYTGAAWSDSMSACETDSDSDGYGDDSPAMGVTAGTDCDDSSAGVNPGVTEMTGNGIDDDCNVTTSDTAPAVDSDGDGYASDVDCNDSLASIHPGATEACNGVDDDCDGSVDEGLTMTVYPDGDLDGYGAGSGSSACAVSAGWSANNTDCNDSNGAVNPGVAEIAGNGIDDDCNGGVEVAGDGIDNDGNGVVEGEELCADPISGVETLSAELYASSFTDDPNVLVTTGVIGTGTLCWTSDFTVGEQWKVNAPVNGGAFWWIMVDADNLTAVTFSGMAPSAESFVSWTDGSVSGRDLIVTAPAYPGE